MPKLRLAFAAVAAVALSAGAAAPAPAQTISAQPLVVAQPLVAQRMLPINQPARGLVYDGLKTEIDGKCERAYRLIVTQGCTPGPAAPPAGLTVATDVPLLTQRDPKVQCEPTDVNSVQVIYAHATDVPSRYAQVADSIRQWAGSVDTKVRNAALDTGGELHLRWLHDAGCRIQVADVELPPAADDTFDATIAALRAKGFNRTDRTYLVFAEANVYCGIAEIHDDDRPGTVNDNNSGRRFARIDAGCWSRQVVAKQFLHTLGAVQLSAPLSDGRWGCACDLAESLDAGPSPAGYLATHWNLANSRFLSGVRGDLRGYVTAPTGVTRVTTGAYTATFAGLAGMGGTVEVTAVHALPYSCKVSQWQPVAADLLAQVRCFDTTGAPVDSAFTATFARIGRALPGKRFAYVRADQPLSPSYVADPAFSYNSEGRQNTVVRYGTGRYLVQLPGLGGSGGFAKATAFGTGPESCTVVDWPSSGTVQLVDVRCYDTNGAGVDTSFVMTFHADDGILGVPLGAERAHLTADRPTEPGYVPSSRFSSTGGSITVERVTAGWYRVDLHGFATADGTAQVTARAAADVRCTLANVPAAVTSTRGTTVRRWAEIGVHCFDHAGQDVDAAFALSYAR